MDKRGVTTTVFAIGVLILAIAAGSTLFAFGNRAAEGRLLDARMLASELSSVINALCLNPGNLYANYAVNKEGYVIGLEENKIIVRTSDGKVIFSESFSRDLCEISGEFFEFSSKEVIFSKEDNRIFIYGDFPVSEKAVILAEKNFSRSDFAWPSKNRLITSCFGLRDTFYGSKFHEGIDIRSSVGEDVFAASNGNVVLADEISGIVAIDHDNGIITRYLHLNKVLVEKGQSIKKGDKIAESGSKNTNEEHLDFRISVDGKYVDPLTAGIYDPEEFDYKLNEVKRHDSNCHYNIENYEYANAIGGNLLRS